MMESIFGNIEIMSKLFAVRYILGRSFLSLNNVLNAVYVFVLGKHDIKGKMDDNTEQQRTFFVQFSADVDNLNYLYPDIFFGKGLVPFKCFDDFCKTEGFPFSAVLVSDRQSCRDCGKQLTVCNQGKEVIVYHLTRGTYLGSRFTKTCLKCKIQEHYGFYKKAGKRVFDVDCLQKEFLMTTEDTAIDLKLLQYLDEGVVQGACPFQLKAKVYNSVHGYHNEAEQESEEGSREDFSQRKKRRYNRGVQKDEKLHLRESLDRRRLEEAFLLYAVLKMHFLYNLEIDHVDYDRNTLVEKVTETFRQKFLERWSGHRCKENGCGSVLVLDGNMKNARIVCSCKSIGTVDFDGLGSLFIGCPNTPKKGIRYCEIHQGIARQYLDEKNTMEDVGKKVISREEDLVIVKILSNKMTRQGNFCEVEWCNGEKSWIRECNLPPSLRNEQSRNVVKAIDVTQFGKKLHLLVKDDGSQPNNVTKSLESNGFGVDDKEDQMVEEGNHVMRKLVCGTSKEKQKAKNIKTAGCLSFQWPCGIVISIAEMFNCESKSQVYGHLHQVMQNHNMSRVKTICYDDACHLLRYAQNAKRKNLTEATVRIGNTTIVVDKFHFRNHVDEWCKANCNPYISVGTWTR